MQARTPEFPPLAEKSCSISLCTPTAPGQKPAHDARMGFGSWLLGKCQRFAKDRQEEAGSFFS